MKYVALCLLMFFSFSSFCLPTAEVSKLRGDVFFNGKKLAISDQITVNGTLKTAGKSFVKITIKDWNSSIVLGPKGIMEIDLSSKEVKKKYTFLSGSCRWVTELNKKAKGAVYTKNASVGARGTDYILKVTKLLGESEIVVIDGEVEFKNINNPSDSAIVSKGQWGGLGGRYGNSIGDILSLPKNVVEAFDKQLKL